MFDFETTLQHDGTAVISVQGSLDGDSRNYFFSCLEELIDDGYSRIIVECDGLGYISSSGLAALINARRVTRSSGGKIYLTHIHAAMADILHLTKLNRLLAVYPTTRELLPKLRKRDDRKVDNNLELNLKA